MSKTRVEPGTIVICPEERCYTESDGFIDRWLFDRIYGEGKEVPTDDFKDCKVLKPGDSSEFFDEYDHCTLVNEDGKAVFYDFNGRRLFDDEGNLLNEYDE